MMVMVIAAFKYFIYTFTLLRKGTIAIQICIKWHSSSHGCLLALVPIGYDGNIFKPFHYNVHWS